jgi:hypothetical protein
LRFNDVGRTAGVRKLKPSRSFENASAAATTRSGNKVAFEYLQVELAGAKEEIRLLKEKLLSRPASSRSPPHASHARSSDLSGLLRQLKNLDPAEPSQEKKIKEMVSDSLYSFEKVIWFLLQGSDVAVDPQRMIQQNNEHNSSVITGEENLKEWRHKHQASAFQLTYGSPDDFKRGLAGLVGQPTPKADDFEGEMRREHEIDELRREFKAWPNPKVCFSEPGKKLPDKQYRVLQTVEFDYCLGHSKVGGANEYKESLKEAYGEDVRDTERDIGHSNWPRERFLMAYVFILRDRNREIHAHNKRRGEAYTASRVEGGKHSQAVPPIPPTSSAASRAAAKAAASATTKAAEAMSVAAFAAAWNQQEELWTGQHTTDGQSGGWLVSAEKLVSVQTWRGDALGAESEDAVWKKLAGEYECWKKVASEEPSGHTSHDELTLTKSREYEAFQKSFDDMYEDLKTQTRAYNDAVADANQLLEAAREPARMQHMMVPEMTRLEVLGLRLYTGPMYARYNSVCRAGQKDVYASTIWCINSGLIKLARLTKTSTVYRGVAGKLPNVFFGEQHEQNRFTTSFTDSIVRAVIGDCGFMVFAEKDVFNCAGGVEMAFMSTTTNRDVATGYMRGKAGVVFEINMGMIDKGASLEMLSQYPGESEILFAPLTGLEVRGTKIDDDLMVVKARLNCNLKDASIDELQSKMKRVHHQLCDIVEADCHDHGFDTIEGAMVPLHEYKEKLRNMDSADFNKV